MAGVTVPLSEFVFVGALRIVESAGWFGFGGALTTSPFAGWPESDPDDAFASCLPLHAASVIVVITNIADELNRIE
jgi:hypothetical protein